MIVETANVTAAALKTVNDATTLNVTATAVTKITGSVTELAAVYDGAGITGLGNETITVSDANITVLQANTIE